MQFRCTIKIVLSRAALQEMRGTVQADAKKPSVDEAAVALEKVKKHHMREENARVIAETKARQVGAIICDRAETSVAMCSWIAIV